MIQLNGIPSAQIHADGKFQIFQYNTEITWKFIKMNLSCLQAFVDLTMQHIDRLGFPQLCDDESIQLEVVYNRRLHRWNSAVVSASRNVPPRSKRGDVNNAVKSWVRKGIPHQYRARVLKLTSVG
jgi:hypothetical protein